MSKIQLLPVHKIKLRKIAQMLKKKETEQFRRKAYLHFNLYHRLPVDTFLFRH